MFIYFFRKKLSLLLPEDVALQVPYNTVGRSLDDNLYIARNRNAMANAAYHKKCVFT